MAITDIDEKLLVRAYQGGDERAFDTIVRTQFHALYAHALRRLGDHEAAEDAVQDTLLRAYRALPNLGGDLALRAWLHRILTNVCHDEGNRRRRWAGLVDKVSALPEELEGDPGDEAVLHDTVRVMSEALRNLPDNYREALVLRYVDGLSFREVAEATGTTEENARARVHRGRIALHKVLSRIALILAFVVPGLRRTQQAAPEQATLGSAAGTETGHFVTQLTAHAAQAAPTVSRFAELSASVPGGKSTMAAAALTAVAAVAAPVTYTVREVRRPEPPPAAVAAPAPVEEPAREGSRVRIAADEQKPAPDDQVVTESQVEDEAPVEGDVADPEAPSAVEPFTPRKTSPTTTDPTKEPAEPGESEPPAASPSIISGSLSTASLQVREAGSDFDLDGSFLLGSGESAPLTGRLYLQDGTIKAERLVFVVEGVEYVLRFRGEVSSVTDGDGATTYDFVGKFSLPGGDVLSLPESGDVVHGRFRIGDGAHLHLDLEGSGPASS